MKSPEHRELTRRAYPQGFDRSTFRSALQVVIAVTAAAWLAVAQGTSDANTVLTTGLAWAYPAGSTTAFGSPLGSGPFHMPGSSLTLTRTQMEAAKGPIDWYPEDHPAAPRVVKGPASGHAEPCAECHGFSGAGFPGSADLAGLPAAYIEEQVRAFASGERRSANPHQPNTAEMIKAAKSVTPRQLQEAAAYFAHLPRAHWLRVVETSTVPRTIPDKFGWLDPAPGGGSEPIGSRVVELSDDLPQSFLGNDHVVLTDYVPPGALARGRAIVETGGVNGQPCTACHGATLGGGPTAPPLAGRSAAYLARTVWDIRVGARRGVAVTPMLAPSRALSALDIRDAAAYLASLAP
jgi:cytochrome c553